jgi:probable rRNA maturation factor
LLLNLSEEHSTSIALSSTKTVWCDLSLSEHLLSENTQESKTLFAFIEAKLPAIWAKLSGEVADNPWMQLSLDTSKQLHFSVILVNDEEIQALNRDYRQKDQPTDVLTFTLLGDAGDDLVVSHIPELDLGEIYLSVEWAKREVCKQIEANSGQNLNFFALLTLYLMERLVHGCLHLMGVHHDTMEQYNKVVAIQRAVVESVD